jgi:cell fate regulator YaaT (PSP1 superfamily)
MPIVVGVAFKPVGKIYQYDPGPLELRTTDAVVVEAVTGGGHTEFGFIRTGARAIPEADLEGPLRPVLRKAMPEDYERRERNERRQAEAYRVCQEKIQRLEVPMKLIEAEWAFDSSQVTFHFVAEGRVDFRELVREVAGVLHTRVQMHQVGSRDHAKIFPGIGPCGRPTCCSTFLREFEPVSIKMAKDQHLVQNPSKFTGLCGKLMCCLRYEQDDAGTGRPPLPEEGMVVMTPMGRAKVMEVNAMQQMLTVQLESQAFIEVRLKDVATVEGCVDHTEGGCTDCGTSGVLDACTVPTRDKPTTGPALPMA